MREVHSITMGRVAALLASGAVLAWVVATRADEPVPASAALAGHTFVGELGRAGEDKGRPETLVFTADRMESETWRVAGFGPGRYRARLQAPDVVAFEAEQLNARGDKLRWVGRLRGDTVSGTMTRWVGTDLPEEHWFSVKRTPAPQPDRS